MELWFWCFAVLLLWLQVVGVFWKQGRRRRRGSAHFSIFLSAFWICSAIASVSARYVLSKSKADLNGFRTELLLYSRASTYSRTRVGCFRSQACYTCVFVSMVLRNRRQGSHFPTSLHDHGTWPIYYASNKLAILILIFEELEYTSTWSKYRTCSLNNWSEMKYGTDISERPPPKKLWCDRPIHVLTDVNDFKSRKMMLKKAIDSIKITLRLVRNTSSNILPASQTPSLHNLPSSSNFLTTFSNSSTIHTSA